MIFAHRQRRAKKKREATEAGIRNHQCQLPAMPFWRTRPVIKSGVSEAKDVATSEVPASHQGSRRPDRKKSSTPPSLRCLKARPKGIAVLFCALLALLYSVFSGLWGVVATDIIQFVWALGGAILLAVFAIHAIGGLTGFWETVQTLPQANFLPVHTPDMFWSSPWIFFLSLILIQWWARGLEGDGIAIQRLSACKNEKHSFYAMLWFNIAHYVLRPWPWIIVALVSLVLFPEITNSLGVTDHERAYPRMILELLPVGIRGLVIAGFFAAFMSTVDTHLNWGSSYVVNDVYRRFIRPDATQHHYVWVARVVTILLMAGGGIIALTTSSIVESFWRGFDSFYQRNLYVFVF